MSYRLLLLVIGISALFVLERESTEAAVVYADEFTNTTLESGWLWQHPGSSSTYSISGGSFNLSVTRGADQWIGVNEAPRILRDESPGRPWSIETRISQSNGNSQTHVGLAVMKGSQDFLIWGWLSNGSLEASGYVNGQWVVSATMATKYSYLRIRRDGNVYYFDASMDGANWTNANSFEDTSNTLNGARVGLLGKDWNGGSGTSYTARFDFFRLSDVNPMPSAINGTPTTQKIAQETGAASINATQKYDVCNADYGVMFAWRSRTYIAFGDTNGCGNPSSWRSNTMAWSTDTNPNNGLTFSNWITGTDGKVKELFREDAGGGTALPTGAVGIGSKAYVYYMNVAGWGAPGNWTCTHSELASTTSSAQQNWTKHSSVRWNPGNFNQLAVWRDGTMLYIWGIPCGRFGSVKLMRVPESSIETKSAYRYFAGFSNGAPVWSTSESNAVTVAGGPVGELSVRYNAYLDRLTMTYLDERRGAIVLREAPDPWGPWSAPVVIARASDYPQLYGAFMLEGKDRLNSRVFYWMMSQFGPYNTFWMETTLP